MQNGTIRGADYHGGLLLVEVIFMVDGQTLHHHS